MRSLRFLPALFMGLACLTASLVIAQSSETKPRIVAPVDESRLTRLSGNVPSLAQPQFDRGEAAPETQLTHIRLLLSRSPEQEAALNKTMADLQDKSSPNYHKWLTPQQYGRLFGPADSDIAAVVAWLQSHGLQFEAVSSGRTNIAFSGNVRQVEEAFHTSIHLYEAAGQHFYSNTTEPSIPSALAPVVSGVARLNSFKPRPLSILRRLGQYDPDTHRKLSIAEIGSAYAHPQFTYNDGGTQLLFTAPADAATIYDTPNSVLNANYSAATSYTGKGVTIGLGGDSAILTTDVVGYRTLFLGNTTAPLITNTDGVGINGDSVEAYLDVEVSGGLAPDATIHLYVSSDLFSGIEQAIADNTIDIFSLSFGACELDLSTSDNQYVEGLWQQMETQGIAVSVATGDSGSAGCDDPDSETTAIGGLAVSGFASTPYNIAVGGTDFYGLLTNFSTYATESSTAGTIAGSAASFYRTAKSYIPESSWNESTETNTTIGANVPALGSSSKTNIAGGSGGASSCSVNTSVDNANGTVTAGKCTSGYAKPSWQRGNGVPGDGVRDIPDVSLLASSGTDGALWLLCAPATDSTGNSIDECIPDANGSFYFGGVGGTSAASPAFAGILALVEQKTGSRIGLDAEPELYGLFNSTQSGSIFHDVTVGNNSVVCTAATPDCVKNAAGNDFESGYDTGAGYDLATGLGSVDATQLVNSWGTAIGTTTPTVTATPSAASITTAQGLSVAVSVTGTALLGTPTGTVKLTGGGYTSATETLTNGDYTFTIPAETLLPGTQSLSAAYSGDANYSSASGLASVKVTVAGSYSLTASTVSSLAPGSSGTSTITATATGGYTGTITLNSCVLATGPTGAVAPTCTIGSSPIVLDNGHSTATGTVLFGTTAAAAVKLAQNDKPRSLARWAGAGTLALAGMLVLGIPARRRRWPRALVAVLAVVALGALYGCGGGGGGGTTTPIVSVPTVTTGAASSVTSSTASLAGTVNPNGGDAKGTFLYGTSNTLVGATSVAASPADSGSGNSAQAVTASLTGLSSSTKYYFQAQAVNSAGTGSGAIASFTTPAPATTSGTYTYTVTGTDSLGVMQTATVTVIVS